MSTTNKTIFDKLAEKADELELQRKAEELVDAATKAAHQAVEKVGAYTAENRDKVEGFLDKAAAKVDEQTDGKYADKVAKARAQASKGVAKLAEQRTAGTSGPSATPGTTPVAPSVPTASTASGSTAVPASMPGVETPAATTGEPWAQATDSTGTQSVGEEPGTDPVI